MRKIWIKAGLAAVAAGGAFVAFGPSSPLFTSAPAATSSGIFCPEPAAAAAPSFNLPTLPSITIPPVTAPKICIHKPTFPPITAPQVSIPPLTIPPVTFPHIPIPGGPTG